ncbi:DUF551 domain-containing protein [Niabella sp. CC-SYL272]|uniref:DUF551 domain-containing protein n=1 Tax=Niabella agricola TaxID=2891571 RepID=UPI001F195017|nr:DUF551 domain-containing protein [Niabella agricola]MCF3107295.1 DUF551 domain-containing protein [Niabella agricola]
MDNQQHIADSQRPGGVVVIPELNGWVSVTDRLPVPFESVLLFGIINAPGYMNECCEMGYYNEKFIVYRSMPEIEEFEITHWHQLPDPPRY